MIRGALILFFTSFAVLIGMAQTEDLKITKRKAQFKLMANLDFRRTWVHDDPLGFYGARIGAEKNRNVIALGFYGIGLPFIRSYEGTAELGELGLRQIRMKFDFITLTYERVFVRSKRWDWGVPIGVGLGNYRIDQRDANGEYVPYAQNELLPVDLSVYVNYKITWWGFLGVGGGYRYVYARDAEISADLSNWTWFAKAGLRFGAIYKKIRGTENDQDG